MLLRGLLTVFLPIFVVVLSLGIGPMSIPPSEILQILWSKVSGGEIEQQYEAVIFQIRLPRILFASLVGCSLSVSGAVLQSMLKNPLVEPYLLGISSGAAFGAALALGFGMMGGAVQTLAFTFGLTSVALVYMLARSGGELPVINLVLSGIIVSAIFSALTVLVQYFVDPHRLAAIVHWIMGSFSVSNWRDLVLVTPPVIFSLLLVLAMSWRLNVLSLSDEEAKALGVNVGAERALLLCITTVMTACSVSVVGIIGWVGLLIPHITRLAFGSDNRLVIPASMALGASFMVLADDVARSAFSFELPISVLTTIFGAPVFLYLVRRRAKAVWR